MDKKKRNPECRNDNSQAKYFRLAETIVFKIPGCTSKGYDTHSLRRDKRAGNRNST